MNESSQIEAFNVELSVALMFENYLSRYAQSGQYLTKSAVALKVTQISAESLKEISAESLKEILRKDMDIGSWVSLQSIVSCSKF